MSITMLIINYIIVYVANSGENGVAVYSTGWRIVTIAILPLLGLATAVVSVSGATFGAHSYKKLNISFMYALKFGLTVEIILSIVTFVLAPSITTIFTTGRGSSEIVNDLQTFLKIICLFYPGAALGIVSSAMFQGTGKGIYALIVTLLRTILLTVLLALIFAYIFNPAIIGIWWAIVSANLIGSIISFSWAKFYIHNLMISDKDVHRYNK